MQANNAGSYGPLVANNEQKLFSDTVMFTYLLFIK